MKKKRVKWISVMMLFIMVLQIMYNLRVPIKVEASTLINIDITKDITIKDANSNTIAFTINLTNNSEEELDLSKLSMDYWYSDDKITSENVSIDWSNIKKEDINIGVKKLDESRQDSNSKISISFKEGTNIKPWQQGTIQVRVFNSKWDLYNQLNDYSFNEDITAEYDGKLIHGKQPSIVPEEEPIIKIEGKMYNKFLDNSISSIYPWIKIINTGNVTLDHSKLEIRYYYTAENEMDIDENFISDWSNIGTEKVVGVINKIGEYENADRYASIKFNSSESLKPNSELEVNTRINKSDWSSYKQENDFSFNKDAIDYVDWKSIIVVYDNVVIYGDEPEENKLPILDVEARRNTNMGILNWRSEENVLYKVKRGTSKSNMTVIAENIKGAPYIDAGLDNIKGEYYYQVSAYKDGIEVAKSTKLKIAPFIDSDEDGLEDTYEVELGTDISKNDSDNDEILDGEEVKAYKTNPLKADTDDDGLNDSYEIFISKTDANKNDSDGNGILDGDEDLDKDALTVKEEVSIGTNPVKTDTDNDGINDYDEVNLYITNPMLKDTDDDGIYDNDEITVGLNPLKNDSDSDGVIDGDEAVEYSYRPSKEDEKIKVSVSGSLLAKNINDINITNMYGTNVITGELTPGYIGSSYDIKVPVGITGGEIVFKYDTTDIDEDANVRLYKFDEINQTLVEVKEQIKNEETKEIILPITDINRDIANIPFKISESKHYSVTGEYTIINKKSWDKYLEEIGEVHPGTRLHLSLAFAIDTSGSMSSNDPNSVRVNLAKKFIERKGERDEMAIVGFDSYSSVYQTLTENQFDLLSNIDSCKKASGGTNITAGLQASINEIKKSSSSRKAKRIILLTDGQGTFSDSILKDAKDNGISIYTIGLGNSYNRELLAKIASETDGKYYHVDDDNELNEVIDDIHYDTALNDNDGDGIPNDEDNEPNKYNILLNDFYKADRLFMQAFSYAYEDTSKEVDNLVTEKNPNYNLLKGWRVIASDDRKMPISDGGFGAVALKKGNDIIISYEGSNAGSNVINDWVITDGLGVGLGLASRQLVEAYMFANDIISDRGNENSNIYITGHSLGGWLAQKVTGAIMYPEINLYKGMPVNIWGGLGINVEKNFEESQDRLMKSVTFASPGFFYWTSISGDKSLFTDKLFNYRMDNDPVSNSGVISKLVGRNRWVNDSPVTFDAHAGDYYYKHFSWFFTEGKYYELNS